MVVRYLEFVEGRARRNTVLAVSSDLGIFLSFVDKDPATVTTDDELRFVAISAPRALTARWSASLTARPG